MFYKWHTPHHRTTRRWLATFSALALSGAVLSALTTEGAIAAPPSAAVALSMTNGTAGSGVTVSGSSFPKRASVTLTWDGSTSGMPATATGPNGQFSTIVTIPSAATVGPHTIVASAGSASANNVFQVVSTAPAVSTATATPVPTAAATSTPVAIATPVSGGLQTIAPVSIPLSAPELANPDRGEYMWYGNSIDPSGWPFQDSYTRYSWRQLEPTQGNYNFSDIDAQLANAAARGGRFGFGIMAVDSWDGGIYIPDYLASTSNSWTCSSCGSGHTTNTIPDWNNTNYVSRWTALMQALGARYANDSRLGVMDIRGYGDFGEWHMSGFTYPGPNGQQLITDTNARAIVDATVDNFPNHSLVMLTANLNPLNYALGLSPRIGIRVDCLGGSSTMFGATDNLNAAPGALNRWQTAPFETEWCGNASPGSGVFITGDSQVQQYHVSMLSSGNYHKPWTDFTLAEQAAFIHANQISGYRFILDSLTLPTTITRGTGFTVSTRWDNPNVAPAYRPWTPLLQLRNPTTGAVAWQGTSGLDFRTLLPTAGTPMTQSDAFTLPSTVPAGTYNLLIQVADPSGVTTPLRLATSGRQADGSYQLGTVTVL